MIVYPIMIAILTFVIGVWQSLVPSTTDPKKAKRNIRYFLLVSLSFALVSVAWEVAKNQVDKKKESEQLLTAKADHEIRDQQLKKQDSILSAVRERQAELRDNNRDGVKASKVSEVLPVVPDKSQVPLAKVPKKRPPAKKSPPLEEGDEEAVYTENSFVAKQRPLNDAEKEKIADLLAKTIAVHYDGNMSIPILIKPDPAVFDSAKELKAFLNSRGFKRAEIERMSSYELEGGDVPYEVGISTDASQLPFVGLFRLVSRLTNDR